MQARSLLVVAGIFALCLPIFATTTITPTTTLTAETANNTSAAGSFATQSNGNEGATNISKVATRSLLYPNASTKIYAHFMGWFGTANHMNVGYTSDDPTEVNKQVTDALSRDLAGFILDWYGQNNSMPNNTAFTLMNEAESRNGAFAFAIMYDGGALTACHNTAGCDLTQQAISDLTYAFNNFETSSAYMLIGGRPVLFFFDPDRYGTLNWSLIASSVPGNSLFVFRNAGGFTHANTSGSFGWVNINTSNPNDWGQSYLDNFYSTGLSHPSEHTYGATYKGFNDTLASWGQNRIMNQNCGQTWLSSFSEIGKYYSSPGTQLESLQVVTWNDYEEGSELETGIDNCVSLTAALSGSTISWSASGSESTVNHYVVFISTDGQNLMDLAHVASGTHSLELAGYGFGPGTYTLYIKAVGKPSLKNQMSSAVTYTAGGDQPPVAVLSVSPLSGLAPLMVTASTTSSYDPDGTISSSIINFGDGTVVSGSAATHTYTAAGTYTVTGMVTDNAGLSSSAAQAVNITAPSGGVTISTPSNGATVKAPVHVVASASGSYPISRMALYVDGLQAYTVNAAKLNAYVSATKGRHIITVDAWDTKGSMFSSEVNVTVK